MNTSCYFGFLVIAIFDFVVSLPEPGKKKLTISNDNEFGIFKKIAFKESSLSIIGASCHSQDKSTEIEISWKLKYSPCVEKFVSFSKASSTLYFYPAEGEIEGETGTVECNKIVKKDIADVAKWNGNVISRVKPKEKKQEGNGTYIDSTSSPLLTHNETDHQSMRQKRSENNREKNAETGTQIEKNVTKKKSNPLKTPWTGAYILIIHATSKDKKDFELDIQVDMVNKRGYLSATEWPLLPFFGVMSLVYLIYAIGWFTASCWNWRELLRIQFWIGGVVALGMLEKALFYSEYQNVNSSGKESNGLVVFAELISCLKRALARILVIIVSMGFGIVKPRLGSALPKILACGLLFFVLASIEGCFRAFSPKAAPSRQQMIAAIPLVVLDSVLCWWVFSALVQTTRTLRIRKNVVKLSLYRHFTNTLIFAVVASIIYMAWSIKSHSFADCTDWTEVWLDDAFWPFLFSLVLLVIMILWRPTNNNQRYAFTPLVDFSEDEDDTNLSEAFDGMKMRNMKKEGNGTLKNRNADDDLKWVEENIPSIPTTILPSLDSDEEIMTTKLEMSKMQ